MNDGGRFLARMLRRRHRGATVLLGVAVGLAAGVVLLGAVSARRSSDAVERFVDTAARGVDASVLACPTGGAGLNEADELGRCFSYVPKDEVDTVDSIPGVDVLGLQTAVLAQIESEGMPTESLGSPYVFLPLPGRPDPSSMLPPVVAGRLPAPGSTDEMVLDENTFDALGLEVGAKATVTPFTAAQQFQVGQPGLTPAGQPSTVRIVGVIREPSTLVVSSDAAGPGDNASLYASPGWLDRYTGVAQWGTLMVVSSDLPIAELDRRVRAALPSDRFQVEVAASQMREPGVVRPANRAVGLETWSTWIATGLLAFAAMVFVGQALARQTSREWEDGSTLRALGLTRHGAARIGAARAVPIALVGAVTAVAVAIAGSPLTPVGLARRVDPDLGVVVDLPVLGIGAALLMIGVIAVMASVARRRLAPAPVRPVTRSSLFVRGSQRLADRPSAWTGLAFAADGRSVGRAARRAAVGGLAFAAVVAVVAGVIPASMGHLLSHPVEYGATHDAYVGGIGDADSFGQNAGRVVAIPEVVAASGIAEAQAFVDDDPMQMLALSPIEHRPPITPRILTGREPIRDDEVAMGQVSMREHGLEIGDRVSMEVRTESTDTKVDATIVGTVALHGETETEPGRGILASWDTVQAAAPGAVASSIIVRFDPERRAAGLAALRKQFADVELAHPQADLRNIDRILFVPALLAGMVFFLALAALVHALVLATRRHRTELATLRAIGFTRGEADGSMIWMAVALASMALVIGVPLGWIVGRTLWRTLMYQLGLASAASTYWVVWVLVPVVVLAVAAFAAYLPARRVTAPPPSETLRAS